MSLFLCYHMRIRQQSTAQFLQQETILWSSNVNFKKTVIIVSGFAEEKSNVDLFDSDTEMWRKIFVEKKSPENFLNTPKAITVHAIMLTRRMLKESKVTVCNYIYYLLALFTSVIQIQENIFFEPLFKKKFSNANDK